MYFYRSKSTLDGLKSVFNVFRRKLSLGAPLCVVRENNSRGPRGITKAINLTNSNAVFENCSKCTSDDILNLIRLVRIELNLLL